MQAPPSHAWCPSGGYDDDVELRWTEATIMADIMPAACVAVTVPSPPAVPVLPSAPERAPQQTLETPPPLPLAPEPLASAPAEQPPPPVSVPPPADMPFGSWARVEPACQLLHAAVFLTEASRDTLLACVPPLLPVVHADYLIVKARPTDKDIAALPVGAEVQLQVTGAAADNMSQAVSVVPPAWLSCADSPGPHITISASATAAPRHAGVLVTEGLAGINTCYHRLPEPFLVYGRLGLATNDHQILYSTQDMGRAKEHRSVPAPVTPAAAPSWGSMRAQLPPQPPAVQVTQQRQQQQQQQLTSPQKSPAEEWPGLGPSQPAKPLGRPAAAVPGVSPGSKGGKAVPTSGGKLSLKDFFKSELASKAQGGGLYAAAAAGKQRSGQRDGAGAPVGGVDGEGSNRVCWLGNLSLGDYVEVEPLLHVAARGSDGGSRGELSPSSASQAQQQQQPQVLVEGFVEELLMDEEYQPQGLLVRLHDNTMGHALRVVARRGPAAAAAAAAYTKRLREQQESGGGGGAADLFGGGGGGGGVAASSYGRQASQGSGAGGTLSARVSGSGQAAAGGEQAPGGGGDAAVADAWEKYRQQYGEALTAAVLEDCGGDVASAVETLNGQASLLSTDALAAMDQLVARAVSRAQTAAATNLATVVQEDQARRAARLAARAAAAAPPLAPTRVLSGASRAQAGPAGGEGAPAAGLPPAPGVRAYTSTADDELEPVSSAGGRRSVRASVLVSAGGRRSPGPVLPHGNSWGDRPGVLLRPDREAGGRGSGSGEPWPTPAAAAPQLRLLTRPDSLATTAAHAGLNIRAAEALKAMLPGYSSKAVVDAMLKGGGDVNAAADLLLASGPPTEAGDAEAAVAAAEADDALWGDSEGSEDEAEEAEAGGEAARQASEPGAAASATGAAARPASTSDKVSQLLANFEGLDRSLAEFLLRQCGGDVQSTSRYILEEVLGGKPRGPAAAPVPPPSDQAAAAVASKPPVSLPAGAGTPVAAPAGPSAAKAAAVSASTAQGGVAARGVPGAWERVARPPARPPRRRLDGPQQQWGGSDREADEYRMQARLESDQARQVAKIYYDARNVLFQQAAAAYSAGDGQAAAVYSRRAKEMTQLAHKHRDLANEAAYRASNSSIRNQYVMDLHFMFVDEALGMLRRTLTTLQALDNPKGMVLKVITGAGNHSVNNVPVIKNAVVAYLREQGCQHFVDPTNEGVVCIQLGGK